jgi:signal transduction histidine kinase
MLHDLQRANDHLKRLAKKDAAIREVQEDFERRLTAFQGYVSYSRLFVRKAGSDEVDSFAVSGQVRYVMKHFSSFAEERGITITNEIARDVKSPLVPVTAYSGILVNLLTNALKAIIAVESSIKEPMIVFRGWNEQEEHNIEVLDNGVGIPPQLRKRIWDPLYTTTSDRENPLGSGMGLGLTLVKQVVAEFGGKVKLITPAPPGFTTCFRVTFPMA